MMLKLRIFPLLVSSALILSCDDPPPANQGWSGAGGGAGSPARVKPKKPPPAKKAGPPKIEIEMSEKDFLEGPSNRDPFRSFLGGFKPNITKPTKITRNVIMPRYGLDELKLIAVVTGGTVRPRAMFRNPKGLGVTVKRGDYISKSGSRIKRILRDKVVVEIEEMVETKDQASRKATFSNRVIELHPKESVGDKDEEDSDSIPDSTVPAEAEKATPDKRPSK